MRPQFWSLKAYRDLGNNEREYGYLVPRMKKIMEDIIPGISSQPGDCMVYLGKGENIAISKLSNDLVSSVTIGVRWDKSPGDFVDLDLGCMMLGVDTSLFDFVSFFQKGSKDGSVHHGGDNADEVRVVDKEKIHVDLAAIPTEVQFLAFYLSSFTGKPLMEMQSCDVSLVDAYQRELVVCDCDITDIREHTAVLLCLLIKTTTGWYFQNASSFSDGLLLRDNLEHLQGYVISNPSILRAMTRHRRDSV